MESRSTSISYCRGLRSFLLIWDWIAYEDNLDINLFRFHPVIVATQGKRISISIVIPMGLGLTTMISSSPVCWLF